jgi:hypothetical protein
MKVSFFHTNLQIREKKFDFHNYYLVVRITISVVSYVYHFFGRFQMIFACANWSGPEIKTYFGMSKNNGFFLGAFKVIMFEFG